MLPVTLAILHELSVSEDNAEPKVIGDALGTTTAIGNSWQNMDFTR